MKERIVVSGFKLTFDSVESCTPGTILLIRVIAFWFEFISAWDTKENQHGPSDTKQLVIFVQALQSCGDTKGALAEPLVQLRHATIAAAIMRSVLNREDICDFYIFCCGVR